MAANGEEPKKPKTHAFKYHINLNGKKTTVCKQAFMGLYGITHKRVWRLSTLQAQGETPREKRGKSEGSRHNAIPGELCVKIQDFIESFDVKEIHYSNNIVKKYLSATLDVKSMHRIFVEKFPELESNIKYDFFNNFFKENFDLSFGRPQIDVCSKCEELKVKLRDPHLNDNAKRVASAELMIHKRRSNKFFKKIEEIKNICTENDTILGINIDYMQNLPLPHVQSCRKKSGTRITRNRLSS